MIIPRVKVLGDPTAATPWVGVAKKLARECYRLGISHKVYSSADSITIVIRNIFPATVESAGICQVLIQGGSDILRFECYPKTADAFFGFSAKPEEPWLGYGGYQLETVRGFLLWSLLIERESKLLNCPSRIKKKNQFYISPGLKNLTFYPGPQGDLPIPAIGNYQSTPYYLTVPVELIRRVYEPVFFFGYPYTDRYIASINPCAVSQYAYQTVSLASYSMHWPQLETVKFIDQYDVKNYFIRFTNDPEDLDPSNICLGVYKNKFVTYKIEAIPKIDVFDSSIRNDGNTSYISIEFVYYYRNEILDSVALGKGYVRGSQYEIADYYFRFFPCKFNEDGTKFATLVQLGDTYGRYAVIEYDVSIENDKIILDYSIIEQSYVSYSLTSESTGTGPLPTLPNTGTSARETTTVGTTPVGIWYANNSLQIARINISNSTSQSINHSHTGGESGSEYSHSQTDVTNIHYQLSFGNITLDLTNYTETKTLNESYTTTNTEEESGGGLLSTGSYSGETIKATTKSGKISSILAADFKNSQVFIENTGYTYYTKTISESSSGNSWYFDNYSGADSASYESEYYNEVIADESYNFNVVDSNNTLFSKNLLYNTSANESASYSMDIDTYEPVKYLFFEAIGVCPSTGSVSTTEETSISLDPVFGEILSGTYIDKNLTGAYVYDKPNMKLGISYAGINKDDPKLQLTQVYHYLANIVGICPASFHSSPNYATLTNYDFVATYEDVNIITSSIENIATLLPIENATIYPISLRFGK